MSQKKNKTLRRCDAIEKECPGSGCLVAPVTIPPQRVKLSRTLTAAFTLIEKLRARGYVVQLYNRIDSTWGAALFLNSNLGLQSYGAGATVLAAVRKAAKSIKA